VAHVRRTPPDECRCLIVCPAASGCRHGSRSRRAGGTWSASGTGDRLAADRRVRVQARGPWPDLLKDVDDAIDERRAVPRDELATDGITSDAAEELLESRDEYTAEGMFWVTPEARRRYLNQRAKQPEIGKLIDNAMDLIEVDNPSLRCMVPKSYARPSLDVRRIGTGTTVTYTLSHPLVVDLLTVARSQPGDRASSLRNPLARPRPRDRVGD
jgi:hypothetical protein